MPITVVINTGSALALGTSTLFDRLRRRAPEGVHMVLLSKDTTGLRGKAFDGAVLAVVRQLTAPKGDDPGARFVVVVDNNNPHRSHFARLLDALEKRTGVVVTTLRVVPEMRDGDAALAAMGAFARASAERECDPAPRPHLERELTTAPRDPKGDGDLDAAVEDALGEKGIGFVKLQRPVFAWWLRVAERVKEAESLTLVPRVDKTGIRGAWIARRDDISDPVQAHPTLCGVEPSVCAGIAVKFAFLAKSLKRDPRVPCIELPWTHVDPSPAALEKVKAALDTLEGKSHTQVFKDELAIDFGSGVTDELVELRRKAMARFDLGDIWAQILAVEPPKPRPLFTRIEFDAFDTGPHVDTLRAKLQLDDLDFVEGNSLHHVTLAFRPSAEHCAAARALGETQTVKLTHLLEGVVSPGGGGGGGDGIAMSAFRASLSPEAEALVESGVPHVTFCFDASKGRVAKHARLLFAEGAEGVSVIELDPPLVLEGRVVA